MKLPDHTKRIPGKLVRAPIEIGSIKTVDGLMVAMTLEIYTGTPKERVELRNHNADHFVRCWNACEGYNPEAFPRLMKWLKKNEKGLSNFLSGRDGPFGDDAFEMIDILKMAREKT